MKTLENQDKYLIKFKDMITDLESESLKDEFIDVNFYGHMMVRFENKNGSLTAVNAVNGGGYNVADEVSGLTAELYAPLCRIAELEKEREWISVKDRLPEEEQEVLAYSIFGLMTQRSWMAFTDQDSRFFKDSYTHWMPLPSPPSKK